MVCSEHCSLIGEVWKGAWGVGQMDSNFTKVQSFGKVILYICRAI